METILAKSKQPNVKERADPWVYKHTDNYYYFTGSVPVYKSIELRRARSLDHLENAERVTVWQAPETGIQSQLIWAPEIHYLNNKWYIYFAASDHSKLRNEKHHHRMFVIENAQENSMNNQWQEKGQITTQFDSFSLDATIFTHKEQLYYVWAQLDPRIPSNSNLYISKMRNPRTLKGKQTLLSIPEYNWEKIGFKVNEGPAVIQHKDKVFITYSASATDENYAMGLLWAFKDSDLLDGFSWYKLQDPIFKTCEETQFYGPGHNSFTKGENDQTDILIFHARPKKNDFTDPLSNPNRHTYAQTFTWDKQGFPIFGKPGIEMNFKGE